MRLDDQDGRAEQRKADERFQAALARAIVEPVKAPPQVDPRRFNEGWLQIALYGGWAGCIDPWAMLAQRLHWTHGTEETLRRLNASPDSSHLPSQEQATLGGRG